MSRIDVAIPAYNQGRFLAQCVQSVLAQPVDLRVLIIDDCSSDDTQTVAASLVALDERVSYRRHATNIGPVSTFNECLEWATADYTHLIAADDILTPAALARSLDVLDRHPEVALVYGQSITFQDGESLPQMDSDLTPSGYSVMTGREFIERTCAVGYGLITALTVTVRTRVQQAIGGYRSDFAPDP